MPVNFCNRERSVTHALEWWLSTQYRNPIFLTRKLSRVTLRLLLHKSLFFAPLSNLNFLVGLLDFLELLLRLMKHMVGWMPHIWAWISERMLLSIRFIMIVAAFEWILFEILGSFLRSRKGESHLGLLFLIVVIEWIPSEILGSFLRPREGENRLEF